jgi:ribonuclease HIII
VDIPPYGARIDLVSQRTLVLTLQKERGDDLRRRLADGPFELRSVPHADFSAKGEGVVATLYTSGKLVIQGADPEGFAAAWLGEDARGATRTQPKHDAGPAETAVGSDESGKGDYFGPLVVAAVRLEPDEAEALAQGTVCDSKKLTDERALQIGAALRERFPHAIARLDPPEYNARHAELKNLNPMLAALHAEAIAELARPGMRVIVDQFAAAPVLEKALADLDVRLHQRPRAEEITAVAAASVLAREEFLLSLRRLSEECGADLCKGAGAPADEAARRVVALHGPEGLGRVAKLHFKNTGRVR